MLNSSKTYLTNVQYLDLLKRARSHLDTVDRIEYEDSTTIGNKYTETNVGLCNDELTTKETALFPKTFPERNDMKYRKEHQKCPLDKREKGSYGCFYACLIFQKRLKDLGKIKALYNQRIEEEEKKKL